jgi:hypothetical protein
MKKLDIMCTTILLGLCFREPQNGGCPCPLSPEDTAYGTDALLQ